MWRELSGCRLPGHSISYYVLFCYLLVLAACSPAITPTPSPEPILVRVGYTDSVRPLADAILPILGDEWPAANIESESGHALILSEKLEAGQLDAVFIPGQPESVSDWWVNPVALDGLALIANRGNRVAGLTLAQTQGIFQGRVWLWETVGGAPAEVEVVTRAEDSAVGKLFQELVMAEHRITLTAVLLPDTEAVLSYVASRPWAIGYVPAATVDERVKLLALDGVYPSPETLTDQSYPLTFPIYFAAAGEPVGEARRLPAWLVSRDGQAVIGRHYGRVR
jgi:phosphate transport system substrate-binding protein